MLTNLKANKPINPIYGTVSLNQNSSPNGTMKNKIQEMKNKANLFYSNQKLLNKTKLSQMRASKKDV